MTEGEEVKLTAVFSDGQGTIDTNVGFISSGQPKTVKLSTTTTYTLTVESIDGVKVSSSITINTVRLRVLSIPSPIEGETVHDSAIVEVEVIVQDGLGSITAEVDGNSQVIYRHNGSASDEVILGGGYYSFTGFSDGDYILNITVRDNFARTATTQKSVTVDNHPKITIIEPSNHKFVNSQLPLVISCTDNSDDCLIRVKHQGTIIASATNILDEIIDLSAFIGKDIILTIEGENSSGQLSTETITSYITDNAVNITHIKNFSDQVINFDGIRALIYNDVPSENKQLQIANTVNDIVTIIEFNNKHKIYSDRSLLTPTGATFSASTGSTYIFNNNELINLGSIGQLRVASDFVAYCDNNNLILRTLSDESTITLDTEQCSIHGVSVDGTVIGSKARNIVRYKNQEEMLIDENVKNSNEISASQATINGSLILFYESTVFRTNRVILYDNIAQIIFTGDFTNTGSGGSYNGSTLNNGWFAYISGGNIWTRDINGSTLQRTDLSGITYIDSMSENGELMLTNDDKRYLSKPNGDLLLISSSDFDIVTYENGAWYIINDKSLYMLSTY